MKTVEIKLSAVITSDPAVAGERNSLYNHSDLRIKFPQHPAWRDSITGNFYT